MSEELAWRAERSFEWEATFGEARELLARTQLTTLENLKAVMRSAGYQQIHDINGTLWAEPGMEIGKFNGALNPAIEQAIERVVERSFRKVLPTINRDITRKPSFPIDSAEPQLQREYPAAVHIKGTKLRLHIDHKEQRLLAPYSSMVQ